MFLRKMLVLMLVLFSIQLLFSGDDSLTLTKHAGNINALVISSDSKYVASGSNDKTAKLWNISDGKLLKTFGEHNYSVENVCFSPDNKYLVSSDFDYSFSGTKPTVYIWEIESGVLIKKYSFDNFYKITALSISPDGKTLIAATKSLVIWDISSGKIIHEIKSSDEYSIFTAVSFSPDGKLIVSGETNSSVKILDIASGKEKMNFIGNKLYINYLSFINEGNSILTSSWDKYIRIWNISDGTEIKSFEGANIDMGKYDYSPDFADSVTVSPDNKFITYGSWTGFIKTIDFITGKEIRKIKVADPIIFSVRGWPSFYRGITISISKNCKFAVAKSKDNKNFNLWDIESGKIIW